MIVFGAIAPHSPLLAPRVGKERREEMTGTLQAYREIEDGLIGSSVETLIIISPHAQRYPDAMSGNMAENFTGTLRSFGDHETSATRPCDILLLDRIQNSFRMDGSIPFTLTSSEELDYGYTVPLMLTENLHARLVPLSPSLLDARIHASFGRALKHILHETSSRVGIIASADLSHRLSESSPAGYTAEGPAFDATIRSNVASRNLDGLLSMDAEAVEAAGQCGYLPIVTIMGIFDGMNVDVKELCYEAPFGVGMMTAIIEPR
ncbi:MAG: AmmeMemoRadiSam system protein B [Patescibacteria group bacterium]